MEAITGARGGLQAYQDSIRLDDAKLVMHLRDVLGAKLVAYLGSVKETLRFVSGPTAKGCPHPRS